MLGFIVIWVDRCIEQFFSHFQRKQWNSILRISDFNRRSKPSSSPCSPHSTPPSKPSVFVHINHYSWPWPVSCSLWPASNTSSCFFNIWALFDSTVQKFAAVCLKAFSDDSPAGRGRNCALHIRADLHEAQQYCTLARFHHGRCQRLAVVTRAFSAHPLSHGGSAEWALQSSFTSVVSVCLDICLQRGNLCMHASMHSSNTLTACSLAVCTWKADCLTSWP